MSALALEPAPTRRLSAPASISVPPGPRPEPIRSIGLFDRSTAPVWASGPVTWIVSALDTMSAIVIACSSEHGSSWAQVVTPAPAVT